MLRHILLYLFRSVLLELNSSDIPSDSRWVQHPTSPESHYKKQYDHAAASPSARVSTEMLLSAVKTVFEGSLARAAVLCDMHIISTVDAESRQAHKVPPESSLILNDLRKKFSDIGGRVKSDRESIELLYQTLIWYIIFNILNFSLNFIFDILL